MSAGASASVKFQGNQRPTPEDWYEMKGGARVLRGGAWDSDGPRGLASSKRVDFAPDITGFDSGFRVVLVVGERVAAASEGFVFDLPGLPSGAKKLELASVPRLASVSPFFMGKYEVTQGQYEALMGTNTSAFKKGPDYPVEQVSWDEAKEFCRRLAAGSPDKLKGKAEFRLPTDAEWSVAVGLPEESGRTPQEKDGKITDMYPWGAQWPPPSGAGNYRDKTTSMLYGGGITDYDDGFPETAPVGTFKPNRHDLYDLGGNVSEWCEDWYDGQSGARVLRGESWSYRLDRRNLLSSHRYYFAPVSRNRNYGFRVVMIVGGAVR